MSETTVSAGDDGIALLQNVRKSFGARDVLRGTDIVLAERGITCLLGASGCGKSTLLRITAGLEAPDSGRVLVQPEECAMVFQDPRLLPWLTAGENLRLALPSSCPDAATRMTRALAMVELPPDTLSAMPRELSGGMAQRVGVARALLRSPRILLMDEPFASLDAITREKLQIMLKKLMADSLCLLVTHDMEEALRVGSRLCVMDHGVISESFDLSDTTGPERRETIRRNILTHLNTKEL
ncbi:ABC transporter ATP-binding protein [uncultured Mailhella sp.]|uniref:ABC transporter ATP-binding protein n=1 Tax=uncultured Mailhella sp. TaxID=1981031 RepID=UPI0025F09C9A|nr:ABC transporter ATP-binding protein [uncultured Mailhella sp.]